MSEFSRHKLLESVKPMFEVHAIKEYNRNLLTPTQVFLALRRRR